jgi:hypothetical protein
MFGIFDGAIRYRKSEVEVLYSDEDFAVIKFPNGKMASVLVDEDSFYNISGKIYTPKEGVVMDTLISNLKKLALG